MKKKERKLNNTSTLSTLNTLNPNTTHPFEFRNWKNSGNGLVWEQELHPPFWFMNYLQFQFKFYF